MTAVLQSPGKKTAVLKSSSQLLWGEAKVSGRLGEGHHFRMGVGLEGQETGSTAAEAIGQSLIQGNPDWCSLAYLLARQETTAEPVENDGEGNMELLGGCLGGYQAAGRQVEGNLMLVAQMADPLTIPISDGLTRNVSRVVLDMPTADQPFVVESAGNLLIIVACLSQVLDPCQQVGMGRMARTGADGC